MLFASLRALALMLIATAWTLSMPACSSESTNSAAGGASGAAGTSGAPCVNAGDNCAPCCALDVGKLAETAFHVMAKQCVCDGAPFVCAGPCGKLCSDDSVSGACAVCLRTEGAACVSAHCTSAECKDFRACVQTCK